MALCLLGCNVFLFVPEGSQFTVWTDHLVLLWISSSKEATEILLMRYLRISEFHVDAVHQADSNHNGAKALSIFLKLNKKARD